MASEPGVSTVDMPPLHDPAWRDIATTDNAPETPPPMYDPAWNKPTNPSSENTTNVSE